MTPWQWKLFPLCYPDVMWIIALGITEETVYICKLHVMFHIKQRPKAEVITY